MGFLIEGVWGEEEFAQETGNRGDFRRVDSRFRDRITADGSSGFKAEPDRYHLYVAHGCPWAHRTLIYRALKRLEGLIPRRGRKGSDWKPAHLQCQVIPSRPTMPDLRSACLARPPDNRIRPNAITDHKCIDDPTTGLSCSAIDRSAATSISSVDGARAPRVGSNPGA